MGRLSRWPETPVPTAAEFELLATRFRIFWNTPIDAAASNPTTRLRLTLNGDIFHAADFVNEAPDVTVSELDGPIGTTPDPNQILWDPADPPFEQKIVSTEGVEAPSFAIDYSVITGD